MNCPCSKGASGIQFSSKHGEEGSRDCIRAFFTLPGFLTPVLPERTVNGLEIF